MKNADFIQAAIAMTKAAIARRTPPVFATAVEAYKRLGQAIETVKSLTPENAVPASFATSVNDVIESLEAFRSGYVSNNPAQNVDRLVMSMHSPNIKKAALNKSLPGGEFQQMVLTELETAIKEPTAKALRRLHKLGYALETAESVQDKDVVNFADGNDEMKVVPTSAEDPGAKNPSGTSSPSTAPSNFASNTATGDLPRREGGAEGNAADPSRTPGNGYADSVEGEAARNSGPREMTSTPSNMGPSSSTAAVEAVANQSTTPKVVAQPNFAGNGVGYTTKAAGEKAAGSTEAVVATKAAEAPKTIDGVRAAMEKAATEVDNCGWPLDLNTRDFMRGERKVDFGRDGSKV